MTLQISSPGAAVACAADLLPFGKDHLDAGVALSTAAGWAHRREDWAMLLPLSSGLVAMQGGRVVGTALRSDFGERLSTVNMVIVEAAMRGQGIGRALVTGVIGEAPPSLRLVATASGRPLYETLGFEVVDTISTLQGRPSGAGTTPGIGDAAKEELPEITRLESASFGGDRGALVAWFWENARIAVHRRRGAVTGFAVSRRFGNGVVIGPVVAPDAEEGLALIAHLAQELEGELVRLDVTEASDLVPGLERMGLSVTWSAPVMQRGEISAKPERLAMASQALA